MQQGVQLRANSRASANLQFQPKFNITRPKYIDISAYIDFVEHMQSFGMLFENGINYEATPNK